MAPATLPVAFTAVAVTETAVLATDAAVLTTAMAVQAVFAIKRIERVQNVKRRIFNITFVVKLVR